MREEHFVSYLRMTIKKYQSKIEQNLTTIDYAKGYCHGILDSLITDDEKYDELAKEIDDAF